MVHYLEIPIKGSTPGDLSSYVATTTTYAYFSSFQILNRSDLLEYYTNLRLQCVLYRDMYMILEDTTQPAKQIPYFNRSSHTIHCAINNLHTPHHICKGIL